MRDKNIRLFSRKGTHITPKGRHKRSRRRRRLNYGLSLMFCIFSVFFVVSIVMVTKIYIQGRTEQAVFNELASSVPAPILNDIDTSPLLSPDEADQPEEIHYTEYLSIYEQNNDFIGWLTIDNTEINYPVMFTPDEPEYYLRRAFNGTSSKSGTPFIGEGGNIDSDCYIIYGHNMKNDTMFGTLDHYAKADFCRETPAFTITTIKEKRVYEVFAAVKTRVLYNDEPGFRYYYQPGDLTESEFSELTSWLIANSLYDTGIVPTYGEQIVILSTCSYHTDNGRFIVAARLVDSEN